MLPEEACDDLWFVRNQIFDAQGYCFGSALGKAIFDNSDCTTSNPELSEKDRRYIAELQAMEAEWECKVDTSRQELNIHSFDKRRILTEQPLHDFTESACLGYLGATIPLYDGPSKDRVQIGHITMGSDILFAHTRFKDELDAWWFASRVILNGELQPDIGWADASVFGFCERAAG